MTDDGRREERMRMKLGTIIGIEKDKTILFKVAQRTVLSDREYLISSFE